MGKDAVTVTGVYHPVVRIHALSAVVRARWCVWRAAKPILSSIHAMTKRQRQVAMHSIANIIWRILNDDGLSSASIGRITGYDRSAIKTGIEKCRERTEDDSELMKIYEEAKKEYLCSNSVTV